jgi:CubicO group peptidase (beta-lactamase class C family)
VTEILDLLPSMQSALDNLARRHGVPGAALAVLDGDLVVPMATGVTSQSTGVPVTPGTLFQIGSITKIYTTTLLLQLADEGLLDLDQPVTSYLPDFAVADQAARDQITPRHLVTHTSGIVGDYFADHGPGDDCIERYVACLKDFDPVHPPGLMYSYCNAGFTVAGRVIERLTGGPFEEAFDSRLRKPLGLAGTTLLPGEMLTFRYAVGHVRRPGDGPLEPVPTAFMLPKSSIAAGSRTSATAADVLRFLRMHLDGGTGPDGTRVLSAENVRRMQQPGAAFPSTPGTRVGLGWGTTSWGGERVLHHNGGTVGQLAFLYALPDRPFAICLLTNSDTGNRLWRDLARWLFRRAAGVEMPSPPGPAAPPPDLDLGRYTGTYERLSHRFEVARDGSELIATLTMSSSRGDGEQVERLVLRPVDETTFVTVIDEYPQVVAFLEPDDKGRPGYLHFGGRAAPRTAGEPRT